MRGEKIAAEFIRLQPYFESLKDDPNGRQKIAEAFRNLPNMPQENYDSSHPRWMEAQFMIDYGHAVWKDGENNQLLVSSFTKLLNKTFTK